MYLDLYNYVCFDHLLCFVWTACSLRQYLSLVLQVVELMFDFVFYNIFHLCIPIFLVMKFPLSFWFNSYSSHESSVGFYLCVRFFICLVLFFIVGILDLWQTSERNNHVLSGIIFFIAYDEESHSNINSRPTLNDFLFSLTLFLLLFSFHLDYVPVPSQVWLWVIKNQNNCDIKKFKSTSSLRLACASTSFSLQHLVISS